MVLDAMGGVVRDAGRHLARITSPSTSLSYSLCAGGGNDDDDPDCPDDRDDAIDPKVAITFVILVERRRRRQCSYSYSSPTLPVGMELLPDFSAFHESFLDLEDRLLDECDEYWADNDEDAEQDEEDGDGCPTGDGIIPLGCEITVAAFHPLWRFGRDDNDDSVEADRAVDYEKRAPHPIISIVMSSAIDALTRNEEDEVDGGGAGVGVAVHGSVPSRAKHDEPDVLPSSAPATRRIAARNEKTLGDMGVERLRELFRYTSDE
jgi:hypothetical protein